MATVCDLLSVCGTKVTISTLLCAKSVLMSPKINLRPVQKPHVAMLINSIRKHGLCIDTSKQGMGKSFCAMHIATEEIAPHVKDPSMPLMLIISNPNGAALWRGYTNDIGIPAVVASYGNLRSTRRAEEKYTARNTVKGAVIEEGQTQGDEGDAGEPMQVTPMLTKYGLISRVDGAFAATDKLRELIRNGIMVVVDEFHNVQGKSAQARAVQMITREVALMRRVEPGLHSCISLLSNTPCQTREHILPLLRLTGIVTREKLYDGRSRQSLGLEELRQYCLTIDASKTNNITRFRTLTAATATELSFKLYIEVLRDEISSHAEVDFGMMEAVNLVKNVSRDQYLAIAERFGRRDDAEKALRDGNPLDRSGGFNLQPIIEAIEMEKCKEFVESAKEILVRDPNAKVAIFLWHTKPLEEAAAALAEYNPIIFNGSLPMSKREKACTDFREDSNRVRAAVLHPVCASEARAFDDQHGGRERHVFISPCYRGQAMAQIPGRFDRITTKSVAHIYTVFFEGFEEERNIYYSLQHKERTSELVKGTEGANLLYDTITVDEKNKRRWM